MKYKIAILEDNELISRMIALNLEQHDFQVSAFGDGKSFLEAIQAEPFDLFILDMLLPDISGLQILEQTRKTPHLEQIPVLILTVQQQVQTKLTAFQFGADDYMVKPFNMEELIARVHALIRRSLGGRSIPSSQVMIINNYKINLASRECESKTGLITLSEKEINLLAFFSKHPGQTFNRADILEEVWGMDVSPTARTIDNFILKFRKLFESSPEKPKHFISVRNQGYRFEK